MSSPPPLQRNIHHKTAKYHLLLALTDGIIIINDILIMVRTYKSINQPQLQCIPKTKCQSQGQREHQTSPGKNWHSAFSFNRLNLKIQVSNKHLKTALICTSPIYLHLTYSQGKIIVWVEICFLIHCLRW